MADAAKPETAPKFEPQKEQIKTAQAQKNVGRPKRTPEEQAEYFYSRRINLVFFLSSAAMLVSFVLMFWDDNDREWKRYQRVFADMDLAKLEDDIKNADSDLGKSRERLKELDAQIEKFYATLPRDASNAIEVEQTPLDSKGNPDPAKSRQKVHVYLVIDGQKKRVKFVELEKIGDLSAEYKGKKMAANFSQSDYMAFRWKYEEAKFRMEEAQEKNDPRLPVFQSEYRRILPQWLNVVRIRDEARIAFDKIDKEQDSLKDLLASYLYPVTKAMKDRDELRKVLDEKQRRLDKEKPSLANKIRNLPILDFFGPTIKIDQQILPAVKQDINFVKVERIDRCRTCHKGIGDPTYAAYDVDSFGRFRDPLVERTYEDAQNELATCADPANNEPDKIKKTLECQKRVKDFEELKGQFRDKFLRDYTKGKVDRREWTEDDREKYVTMFKAHPRLDLYVTSASSHPLERIGCTICHGGDGRMTDFSDCVHTPENEEKVKVWARRDHYHHRELWDEPMLPMKYIESSCRRCHAQQVELDGAPEYTKAMRLYEKVGCYACHRTDMYQILPKDTADPRLDPNRRYRRPGPPFTHLKAKLTEDWAFKWVLYPRAFRPTTQMPRFFGQSNARTIKIDGQDYGPSLVEPVIADSIIQYVFELAQTRSYPDLPKVTGKAVEGEKVFRQIGCMACHRADAAPYKSDPVVGRTYTIKEGKEGAGTELTKKFDSRTGPTLQLDSMNFGPNLASIGLKFKGDQGKKWLYNWVRDPQHHFPETRMPSLRLDEQQAMDVVEFLLSRNEPGSEWGQLPSRPSLDNEANRKILDFLVLEQLKLKMPLFMAENELKEFKGDLKQETLWLGQKMVQNYGCFSCHEMNEEKFAWAGEARRKKAGPAVFPEKIDWKNIEGVGVELTGSQPEGVKAVDRLDFGFTEYDGVNHKGVSFDHAYTHEPYEQRDPANKDRKVVKVHESRQDWIRNKLLDPRVFDGGKLASKPPDELLRMPNFSLTEYESYLLTLLILSFTDHDVKELVNDAKRVLSPDEVAMNRGHRLVREHNCRSCHRFTLESFEVEWKRMEEVDGQKKERTSFVWLEGRMNPVPAASLQSLLRSWKVIGDTPKEEDRAKRLYSYSWASDHRDLWSTEAHASIRPGFIENPSNAWLYYDGREWWLGVDPGPNGFSAKHHIRNWRPQEGGDVLPLIYGYKLDRAKEEDEMEDKDKKWWIDLANDGSIKSGREEGRYPPFLRTQGSKTQSDWLFSFLKNPTPIRPSLQAPGPGKKGPPDLNVRMPTFGFGDEEATSLVHFFWVRDQLPGVDTYPYTYFPEREETSWAAHQNELKDMPSLLSNLCLNCHYGDGQAPGGGPGDSYKMGPDLALAESRLRSRWLYGWLGKPSRLYPATTMVESFKEYDRPAEFENSKRCAAVEYLLNWRRFRQKPQ